MKFGELKSIGHNVADSLSSGIGLMIGWCETDIFAEAAHSPEGYILVDFLTGMSSGAKPSKKLGGAISLYSEALPDLCKSHGATAHDFSELTARFSGDRRNSKVLVTVADHEGNRVTDEYVGIPLAKIKELDALGRIRRKPSVRR